MEVTVNYTNQQKLNSHHFTICVNKDHESQSISLTKVDLAEFSFPSNAKILLEVFKKNKKIRIDAGTVSNPFLFNSYPLPDFDPDESFNIRARVVSTDLTSHGLVIGLADRLRPPTSFSEQTTRPLLRVRKTNTDHLVWNFSTEDNEPILKVSKTLGASDDFLRTPVFTSLVLPEFVRRVADWIITETANNAENEHINNWVQYLSLLGCDVDVLNTVSESGTVDTSEREEWALHCANKFAENGDYLNSIKDFLQEDGLL